MSGKRIALVILAALISCAQAPRLPAGLDSPDVGVVCNRALDTCYDRYGPSIGLTEAFLGRTAAEQLTAKLRTSPPDHRAGAAFSPIEGTECVRAAGPCRAYGELHQGLTAALHGAPERRGESAEARALTYGEWRWVATRYGNDTEARPPDPARYTLRLQRDGTLHLGADCNSAGGRYRIEESRIAIEILHSTRAACPPGSLARTFLRDLGAAVGYFMRDGRLFLDLKYDTGAMEFARRARKAPQDERDGALGPRGR
jgi:heat shock protein HslJ